MVNNSTWVVDIIKQLNISRWEVDKAFPLMLQSFDFSTLYTKIDWKGSNSSYKSSDQ